MPIYACVNRRCRRRGREFPAMDPAGARLATGRGITCTECGDAVRYVRPDPPAPAEAAPEAVAVLPGHPEMECVRRYEVRPLPKGEAPAAGAHVALAWLLSVQVPGVVARRAVAQYLRHCYDTPAAEAMAAELLAGLDGP